MRKTATKIFVLSALLVFAGCTAGSSGGRSVGETDGELTEAELNAQREARFGEGSIPSPEDEGPFRDVHFDYDSSAISDTARQSIEYNVQVLEQNPNIRVQLEGHCDERGTAEYNLALGDRRARSVADLLISYGIAPHRMERISYGEEVPVDSGSHEGAWAKNRRVHFSGFGG